MLLKELFSLIQERYTDEQRMIQIEIVFDEGNLLSKEDFSKATNDIFNKVGEECGFGNGWEFDGQHDFPADEFYIKAESSRNTDNTDIIDLRKAIKLGFGEDQPDVTIR